MAVGVVGGVVLLAGLVLIPLPGPGLLVVPVGLAILALEFAWARRWLAAVRERSRTAWRQQQRTRDTVGRFLQRRAATR